MNKYTKKIKSFQADRSALPDVLKYSAECLKKFRINDQLSKEYQLAIEEVIIKLVDNAEPDSEITVETFHRFNEVHLRFGCPGNPIILGQEDKSDIGGMILDEYKDYLNQSYSSGVNYIDFSSTGYFVSAQIFLSLILAIVGGLIARTFFSDAQIQSINSDFIYPIIRFYAGCMQTIAAPVVFFAIVALIVKLKQRFDHNAHLLTTFINYFVTSIVAIMIGFVITQQYPIITLYGDYSSLFKGNASISFGLTTDLIEKFTFTNLLQVFQISNPVPMLLVAILAGLAAANINGMEGRWIRNAVIALNSIFDKMLSLLYDLIPIFLLFSVFANTVLSGSHFILQIIYIFIGMALLMIPMFLMYVVELLFSGINPIRFFKEYKNVLIENYRIGSNIQALPYNKRMISRISKIPTGFLKEHLSIGSMMNMDGNCLLLASYTVIIAVSCGIEIKPILLIEIAVVLILLSLGAPNQPGSFLVGMVFILSILNVSSDMYDELIIVEALLGTAYSFLNSASDIVSVVSCASLLDRFKKQDEKQKTD